MLIELDGVTKTYGKVAALRGLSVTLPEGSIGLLGPKGSGGGHPFSGAQETWVAPNAAHGFHRLFKYLMVA